MDYSIVIPVLNEVESLEELFEGILQSMGSRDFEVVFVDDGSTDRSFEVIKRLARTRPDHVRCVKFRRNFGKSAALHAGFQAAQGGLVFTMDADLQDEPAEIPNFMDALRDYDIVCGWKKERNDPWHKVLPSRIFNLFVNRLSGLSLHDMNCGFKLYRREVVKELHLYGEMHRFIPAYAHALGFSVTELPVQHRSRKHGVSKFGLERFFRGMIDSGTFWMLSKYVTRPGHLFGFIGMFLGAIGIAILAYFTLVKLAGGEIGFRPLFFAGILLTLSGIQTLSIGLIAELMIHQGDSAKPHYSIKETI